MTVVNTPELSVWCPDALYREQSNQLAHALSIGLCEGSQCVTPFYLQYSAQGLLMGTELKELGNPIRVDFVAGANAHRRKYGGGKHQDIAKAVGVPKKPHLRLLDATAGLGRDAFVLASLGCEVTLIERNPVMYHLLQDGLERAAGHPETAGIVEHMQLILADAIEQKNQQVDVVYLDPMFPPTQKSAKVKKELRYLHHIVGYDAVGAEALLDWAFAVAKNRVVVKRPRLAPTLANRSPTLALEGKSGRFDVYVKSAF